MTPHPPLVQRLASVILVLVVVLGLAVWRSGPISAEDEVADGEFSAGAAAQLIGRILAEEVPHPSGSPENALVQQRIIERFTAIGYDVEVQTGESCREGHCQYVENLIAVLPAAGQTGDVAAPAVMVVSHYDSTPRGPGVSDAGTSVAIVLETARLLKADGPQTNPVIFLLTDAEELGLEGASVFTEQHPLAEHVGVVLNFEARGTSGASLMFETSDDAGWLVNEFVEVAPRPALSSLFFEAYKFLPNDTDLTIFKAGGMAGFGFAFIGDVQNYHTQQDNLANLDRNTLQHQGENALALTRAMAAGDLSQVRTSNLIYHDVLSFFVPRYSNPVGIAMAFVLLGIFVSITAAVRRNKRARIRNIVLAFVSAVLVVVAAGLLFMVPTTVWEGLPLSRLIISVIVIAIATVFSMLFSGFRVNALEASLGVWFFWTVLTLALVLTLPGASIVFFLPAAVAALLHVGLIANSRAFRAVSLLSFLGASLIWVKTILLFDIALTVELGQAIIAPTLAILMTAALPVLWNNRKTPQGLELPSS